MYYILRPFYILRSILSTLIVLLATLLIGVPAVIVILLFGYKAIFKLGLPQLWGKIFCLGLGAWVEVSGKENISKEKGVVYLFSHSSYLDIPALVGYVPGVFNFAASAFVQRYPIVGTVMKISDTIVIYRDDREKSIAEYKKAEERLKKGSSYMIAPEGGRNDGEELADFKSGPFIFAMSAKATLVPVVIYGANKVFPRQQYFPSLSSMGGRVLVDILPEISTADWTEENRKEKVKEVRDLMSESLVRLISKRNLRQ